MMKAELPLVSIITPSFNQGEFIEKTILSVKNQNYIRIEHLIIDGGSTDKTIEIIKKYENTYNMRWISEPDKGQADAIDKGFKMAKGAILTWLNSDDYYLHNKVVSKVIYYFNVNKSIHMVTGRGIYANEKGEFLKHIKFKKKLINSRYMKYADFIFQPSTFLKKEIVEKVPLDRQYIYVFDWVFFLKIFDDGFNVLVVDDFWSAYRRHKKHKTGTNTAERKREVATVAKKNFGACYPQTMYCYGIFLLYSLCEGLPTSIELRLKAIIGMFNLIMSKLTMYRLYSC